MTNNSNPLISIKELRLTAGKAASILNGVNLDLYSGEIHGLLGSSGAGKSLMAMSMLQLLNRGGRFNTEGAIWLNSEPKLELVQLSEAKLSHVRGNSISIIFQDATNAFNPSKRCFEQIIEAVRLEKNISKIHAKAKARELINWVSLDISGHIEKAYPHQLSGGQLQRLMIAMALARDPELLIADEPTTALDSTTQKDVLDLLRRIRDELNITILFITHDLDILANLADRISVMYKGEILSTATKSSFFNSPNHPFAKALLKLYTCYEYRLNKLPRFEDLVSFHPEKNENKWKLKDFNSLQFINRQLKPVHNFEKVSYFLQTKRVKKVYKDQDILTGKPYEKTALKSIDFKLGAGSIVGIVGESGSGKSTLSRILVGLEVPDEGTVEYNGVAIDTQNGKQITDYRKYVQLIFQDPRSSLDPLIKIGNSITAAVRLKHPRMQESVAIEEALKLLKKVNLAAEHFTRLPNELSGGQCQRVCIARTLALEPKVLICDEIVSSLDLFAKADILNILLDQIRNPGLSIIFVTHDLKVLKFIADYVYVMYDGEFIDQGSPEYIFNMSKVVYTQRLVNAIPKFS